MGYCSYDEVLTEQIFTALLSQQMLSGLHAPAIRAQFMYLVSRLHQMRHEQRLWGQHLSHGGIQHCNL